MTGTWVCGTVAVPQADAIWSGVLEPEKMATVGGMRKVLSIGTLGGCPFSALPRTTQPTLSSYDCSSLAAALPLLELRMSGCK